MGLTVAAAVALLAAGCAQTDGSGAAAGADAGKIAGQNKKVEVSPAAGKVEPLFESAAGYYLAALAAEEGGDRTAAARFMERARQLAPDNVDFLRDSFQLQLGEGRIEDADRLARELVAKLPDNQLAHLLLGLEEARDGQWTAAEARMARLPKVGLGTVVTPLFRAWALQGEGKTDEALKALDRLASVPGFAVLHDFHGALIEDLAGRVGAAAESYKRAIRGEQSPSFRVIEAFANYYARQGRTHAALALFDRYKASNPDTVRVELTIAQLTRGGKPAPEVADAKQGLAQAMFDVGSALRQDASGRLSLQFVRLSLLMDPGLAVARLTLADMLAADRRDAEALALFKGVEPDSPLYFTARLRVAEVLHGMGKLDEAVGTLEELAAGWPDRAEPLAAEGDYLSGADRFADAVKAYDLAIARLKTTKTQNWPLYYARGVALERAGQWPRAEQDFLEALTLSPDQPSVLNYLGYSWVDRGVNLDKARALIEKAVKLRPNDGYIVDSLGWVLYREGHYESAVANLEHAVELKPDDPVINDHLGDAYWRVGRLNEARFQWRRALSFKPEPDLVGQIGAKLEHGLKGASSNEHDS